MSINVQKTIVQVHVDCLCAASGGGTAGNGSIATMSELQWAHVSIDIWNFQTSLGARLLAVLCKTTVLRLRLWAVRMPQDTDGIAQAISFVGR